jgi:hypothetical protein
VYSLLPIFLVKVLGASVEILGLMERAAEAANSAMRFASGAASDWLGRRKPLVLKRPCGLAPIPTSSEPLKGIASQIVTILTADEEEEPPRTG